MTFRILWFAVVLAWTLAGSMAQAQGLDNKGTDFILAFLPNKSHRNNIELHLTSNVSTNVTVEYPVNSPTFSTTVAVNPGSVTIVALPVEAATALGT